MLHPARPMLHPAGPILHPAGPILHPAGSMIHLIVINLAIKVYLWEFEGQSQASQSVDFKGVLSPSFIRYHYSIMAT